MQAMSAATERQLRRRYWWRLEVRPLIGLTIVFLFVVGLSTFAYATLSPGILLWSEVAWIALQVVLLFWIAVYAVVEYALWRRTRNVGHRLQFLGSSLILFTPVGIYVPLLLGGWSATFSPPGLMAALCSMVSFFLGIVLALLGYYARRFRAGDLNLFRNLVVREGERIEAVTDGYSERPLSVTYPELHRAGAQEAARAWAGTLGKAGLLLDHRADDAGITVNPVTYTGVGTFRVLDALRFLSSVRRHPERLTWVRIGWDGRVSVHLSPGDYERTGRPVAYHALAAAVADAMVSSLLAFAEGDSEGSAAVLLGHVRGPLNPVRLPGPWAGRLGLAAAAVAALLVLTGVSSALLAVALSPERQPQEILDVRVEPPHPLPGQNVDVYANLPGYDAFSLVIDAFDAIVLAAFNATDASFREMRHVEGTTFGARLGAFPDGTEVTFALHARLRRLGMGGPPTETTLWTPPQTLAIGRVLREGPSGLSLGAPGHDIGATGNLTFRVRVDTTAAVEMVQVLAYVESRPTNLTTGFTYGYGASAFWVNLTALAGQYTAELPLFWSSPGDRTEFTVRYKIVARDTTWNTATTGLLRLEVTR